MSWLTDTLPGIATTAVGGILDIFPGTQPIGIPLTAAGLSMFGGEATNNANVGAAQNAQAFSAAQAQQQEAYQTQMSNTAYQRATADMRAAGVNPMMAINQGGASTPSGSSGQGFMPRLDNAIGSGVQSAIAARSLMADIKSKDAGANLSGAMAAKAVADTNTAGFSAKNMELRNKALDSQLASIKAQADVDQAKAGYDLKAAPYDAVMSRANRESGTAANTSQLFKLFGSGGSMMNPNTGRRPRINRGDLDDRSEIVIDKHTGELLWPTNQ